MQAPADSERTKLAADLLQEAVVASRSEASPFAGPASCGLGDGPEMSFELTLKAQQLLEQLAPQGVPTAARPQVRQCLENWVQKQDALDRQRNHFMKDFRREHGFDRNQYAADILQAWEQGLEELYAQAAERRVKAAEELLAALG